MSILNSRYAVVEGYFSQTDGVSDAASFDYIKQNFGLKRLEANATDSQDWNTLRSAIAQLNDEGKAQGLSYKLFYTARHGEGHHNVPGPDHNKWRSADLYEDWSDPHLTDRGIAQAHDAHSFWEKQITHKDMPAPESYYTSPLYRCIATCNITFTGQDLDQSVPFRPTVKENLREIIGVHPCDRRSSKSSLQKAWPLFRFEDGFTEEDSLWRPDHRETDAELDERLTASLDDIFTNDKNTFISLTTHSRASRTLLRVIGHRNFFLLPGSAMPLLIRQATTIAE